MADFAADNSSYEEGQFSDSTNVSLCWFSMISAANVTVYFHSRRISDGVFMFLSLVFQRAMYGLKQ